MKLARPGFGSEAKLPAIFASVTASHVGPAVQLPPRTFAARKGRSPSVREGGRILRGEAKPSREFTFKPEDVQAIRKKLKKSQDEFALMIGVSVATLRNWEQGRRHPHGPAKALLKIAAENPKAVEKALGRH
ncbi:MAG: helix-turn-helix domain-containing protein [Thermoanaerobaculia bacterium]